MLLTSRFMSANRVFYGTDANGFTTMKDEQYSIPQDTEKEKCKGNRKGVAKGKGKGKKTVKPQQIINDEKDSINRTEILRQTDEADNLQSKTENLQSNETKRHEEEELKSHQEEELKNYEEGELKTDINSMPVIFFEDLIGEEVLITDDKDIFDALPFDNQEFKFNNIDNKDSDGMVKNNITIDYKNNKNIKAKTCGLTILKEEKLENITNKISYGKLKPLSLNSYINVTEKTKTKSEKLTMKPKISRKDNNIKYCKDSEEIYNALMDSD